MWEASKMKHIIAGLPLVALVGCNQVSMPDVLTTGSTLGMQKKAAYEHTISEKRPPQEAFLLLPNGAGDVIDVTKRQYANGVEQLIVYTGDDVTLGQNVAKVKMRLNKVWPKPKGAKLGISEPTRRTVAAEMRKVLSGVPMRISNELHTNAYGPFGYALGRAGDGVNCIYGWQHLRGNGRTISTLPLFNKVSEKPELSLRLRVCRYRASDRQLVDIMRRLRVEADPSQAINPTRVSWNAGTGGTTSLAMPGYEQGGYQSDPVYVRPEIVEAPRQVISKPVAKTAPRKVVAAETEPVDTSPRNNAQHAKVPLPVSGTQISSKRTIKPVPVASNSAPVIVPVPTSEPVQRQGSVAQVVRAPSRKRVVEGGGFTPVPLPN